MINQDLAKKYLEESDDGTDNLYVSGHLRNFTGTAVAEIPIFCGYDGERFIAAALRGGYGATNLSLFKYESNLYERNFIEEVNGVLPIISAHGSSIKREIKNKKPYRSYLKNDLELLKSSGFKNLQTVNFDLYAGQPANFGLKSFFEECQAENLNQLCDILKINKGKNCDYFLLEKIIGDIGSVFRGRGFEITLEIPGSMGWSMFPEISARHFEYITYLADKYLPEAKLCIDVGHVLTWYPNFSPSEDYLKILEEYRADIRMLHISSAGSNSARFAELYKQAYGEKIPLWHAKGLDLALSVCEPDQIKLVEHIRNICSSRHLLEVSENRLPSDALRDYFGQFDLNFIDDTSYFDNLAKQGAILGYNSK